MAVRTLPVVDRGQLAQAGGFEAALVKETDAWLGSEQNLIELAKRVQQPLRKGTRFREFLEEPTVVGSRLLLEEAEAHLLGVLGADEQP